MDAQTWNLQAVRCEPSVCIENPIDSHVENGQEAKLCGEYSYQIDKQNRVYADGGESH